MPRSSRIAQAFSSTAVVGTALVAEIPALLSLLSLFSSQCSDFCRLEKVMDILFSFNDLLLHYGMLKLVAKHSVSKTASCSYYIMLHSVCGY